MAETAARPIPVAEFIEGLKSIRDFKPEAVYSYIKAHPVEIESLRPYMFFDRKSYTRNLIFKNDVFELLALCWDVGQVSRIHNHRDQQCWMAVPLGRLKNQNYRVLDRDPAKKTCRLVPSASCLITPSAPLEVDPDEPVHQVMNLREFRERALSLHIYSCPFSTCEVYQIDRGTYSDVDLYYTTEYGRPSPPIAQP
jgi:predicted metal-dependent enzyme (double-stranded beta helix superfamily)